MLISLKDLKPNKLNANVMPEETREKLKLNIKQQGGKYPPLIVRKIGVPPSEFDKKYTEGKPEGYRIIDGHNRRWALRELGFDRVNCEVWDIDDKTEMLLLATLNELKGTQNLTKRAILLQTIENIGINRSNLLKLIPEDSRRLDFVLGIVKQQDLSKITDEISKRNIEVELERSVLREKFIKEGMDPKRAEAMADIYAFKQYVPKPEDKVDGKKIGTRLMLIFFFDKEIDFKKACEFFETDGVKEPNTNKLLDLIK